MNGGIEMDGLVMLAGLTLLAALLVCTLEHSRHAGENMGGQYFVAILVAATMYAALGFVVGYLVLIGLLIADLHYRRLRDGDDQDCLHSQWMRRKSASEVFQQRGNRE